MLPYLANSIHVLVVSSLVLLLRDLLAVLTDSTFNNSCFSNSIIPKEEEQRRKGVSVQGGVYIPVNSCLVARLDVVTLGGFSFKELS